MAEEKIRQDARISIRTPRARIRGLGVSHHGAGHWWLQRLTAAANVVLMLAFIAIIARMSGRGGYAEAVQLVASPLVSIVLILAILSVTIHMRLGMQVVIEDYVHAPASKIAAVFANNFYAVVVAVACLYAILRVGFGHPV